MSRNRKTITLEKLREWGACGDHEGASSGIAYWKKIGSPKRVFDCVKACIHDGDATPLNDANWLIVQCLSHKNQIRYAIHAAELVIEVFEKKRPEDKRPRLAIEAAKACIENQTKANKDAAYAAAHAAARAAYAAAAADADAAYAAAYAAYTAYAAADAYAAYAAAHAAAYAAYAAADADADAAYAAAYAAYTADAAADADAAYAAAYADAAYAAAYAAYAAHAAARAAYAAAAAYATAAAYAAADAAAKEIKIKCLEYGLKLLEDSNV